jgi:hypothetical protein
MNNYLLTLKVRFEAEDDIDAKEKVHSQMTQLKSIIPYRTEENIVKLQRVYSDKNAVGLKLFSEE